MYSGLEYKWRSLRRIANSYRIQAYIVIALGGLFILALLLWWGGSPPSPSGITALDSGIGVVLACALVALVTSGIATGLFAKAEFIELMIAIEENTRVVALGLPRNGPPVSLIEADEREFGTNDKAKDPSQEDLDAETDRTMRSRTMATFQRARIVRYRRPKR